MPRLGGRHTIKPVALNPRERKELRDTEQRMRQAAFEGERLRRQHFKDGAHLCPVCADPYNGFMSRNGKSALCTKRESQTPDPMQIGYWHRIGGRGGRVCSCGVRHEI